MTPVARIHDCNNEWVYEERITTEYRVLCLNFIYIYKLLYVGPSSNAGVRGSSRSVLDNTALSEILMGTIGLREH
jgi:hypothetical protein